MPKTSHAALSERLRKAQRQALLKEAPSVGSLVDQVYALKKLGLNQALFFLRAHWTHIAGEALARHTVPLGLKDGVLSIQADSALHRQELTYAAPKILRIAQDHLGEALVKSVKTAR